MISYHACFIFFAGGRIVNVSSDYAGGLDLQNTQLDKPGTFERHLSYTASKQVFFMLLSPYLM
jgi:hypothetical protein